MLKRAVKDNIRLQKHVIYASTLSETLVIIKNSYQHYICQNLQKIAILIKSKNGEQTGPLIK